MAVKLNGGKNNTKRRCPELRPQKKKKVCGAQISSVRCHAMKEQNKILLLRAKTKVKGLCTEAPQNPFDTPPPHGRTASTNHY